MKKQPIYPKALPGPLKNPLPAENLSEELLTIVVDLGKGREDTIVVHKGDSPKKLASSFCTKYGLKGEQQRKLALKISQHIDETLMEEHFGEFTQKDPLLANNNEEGICEESQEDDSQEVGEEHTEDLRENLDALKRNKEICHLSNIHEKYGTGTIKNPAIECSPIMNKGCVEFVSWKNNGTWSVPTYKNGRGKLLGPSFDRVEMTEPSDFCSKRPSNKAALERMYKNAITKKKQKEKLARERQRLRELEELQYATFHPEVNHRRANSMALKSKQSAQERLYKQATTTQEKLETAKIAHLLKTKAKCTFQPKINQRLLCWKK